jgi:putative phage-type endonuclease
MLDWVAPKLTPRQQWLKNRKLGIGASDVPSILGVSPYRDIVQLYDEKTSDFIDESTSYVMELGSKLEPVAREAYELLMESSFPACNFVNVEKPHYRCSLDGYNNGHAIEIKYCGAKFTETCPDKYYPQIQFQYAVANCNSIDLVQINNSQDINVIPLAQDSEYIIAMLEKVDWFWDCVVNRKRDEVLNEYERLSQANNGKRGKKAPGKHR